MGHVPLLLKRRSGVPSMPVVFDYHHRAKR
jgi:hypothetical protein